jgi:hypothetical protein
MHLMHGYSSSLLDRRHLRATVINIKALYNIKEIHVPI